MVARVPFGSLFNFASKSGSVSNLADRKSTRLNSSHDQISYAVFCLKTKEHTSELQSRSDLVCRLLLEKKKRPARSFSPATVLREGTSGEAHQRRAWPSTILKLWVSHGTPGRGVAAFWAHAP